LPIHLVRDGDDLSRSWHILDAQPQGGFAGCPLTAFEGGGEAEEKARPLCAGIAAPEI
jgi:hypothetical protein